MSTCTGHCCFSFSLPDLPRVIGRYGGESRQIARMVIPLRTVPRGGVLPSGDIAVHSERFYTCRNLDRETGRCATYDTRPAMCRDYPYGRKCTFKECTSHAARSGLLDEFGVHLPVLGQPSIPKGWKYEFPTSETPST